MMQKIPNIFGKEFVFHSTNQIYRLIKLSVITSLAMLPWLVVNILLKFSTETVLFYYLAAFSLYGSLCVAYRILSEETDFTLKSFFKEAFQVSKNAWRWLLAVNTILFLLVVELQILLTQPQLQWLTPFSAVLLLEVIVIASYLCYLLAKGNKMSVELVKFAAFASLRNFFKTLLLGGMIGFWLVLGYYLPYLNIVFLTGIFLQLTGFLFKRNSKLLS